MSSRLALPDVESLRGRGRLLVCLGLLAVYGCATSSQFRAGERAYLDRFRMSDAQKQAVLERDFTRLIDLGGNIYFLVRLSNTDGWTTQKAVSSMTSMTPDEYAAMMRAGGRSPEGQKSKRDQG